MEKLKEKPVNNLTEEESKQVRTAILFYDASFQNMWNPGAGPLKDAFKKLDGKDFDKKKQQMKEMAVTNGCGLIVEDVEQLSRIEKGV